MQAIIILSIGTILSLILSIKSTEGRISYLITAMVFLFLIGSHVIFNPTL